MPLGVLRRAEVQRIAERMLSDYGRIIATLPGGPLGSLRWLVSSLARAGQTVKAGSVVLTGSPGRLIPILAGCGVVVTCEGRQVRFYCANDAVDERLA